MTPADTVARDLSAAWDEYQAEVAFIVDRAMADNVTPLLRRRRYRFLAGNGTFYVESRTGKQLETDPRIVDGDPDWSAVLDVLNTEIPGMPYNSLGSMASDYPGGAS